MKQNQYDPATKNPNELYMITDTKVSYNDLENKPNNLVIHTASTAVGNSTKPVFVNSSGVVTVLQYTIASSVPSNAVFIDKTYSTFVGSGANAAVGLVPKPPTTAGTSKYLREDGTWVTIDALSSQSGKNGKFLTTNGTTASWADVTLSSIASNNVTAMTDYSKPTSISAISASDSLNTAIGK